MKKEDSSINAKKAAGYKAAELIQEGMNVGIGTGSTSFFFIEKLIERHQKEKIPIHVFATSIHSEELAKKGNLPFCSENVTYLDIAVDGADEIDLRKRMVKGGGGALLREKIVATMSREMVVIVDEHKVVNSLGKFPLPLEIIPFGYRATLKHITDLGFKGNIRLNEQGNFYLTDNQNYIFDLHLSEFLHFEENYPKLKEIPGLLETGFFPNQAHKVITGYSDGHVKIW